jgi:hypothetical protein
MTWKKDLGVSNRPSCATRIPFSVNPFFKESSNKELLYRPAAKSTPSFGSRASMML